MARVAFTASSEMSFENVDDADGWTRDEWLYYKRDKAETLQKMFIALPSTKLAFCFVYFDVAYSVWLLWQLKSFHRLIMGKIGFNCRLIAGILTELFKNSL